MKYTAYAFAEHVDNQIESLSPTDYRRKFGKAKKLLEELYPLSRFALHLKQPGLKVEVEALEKDDGVDGYISLKGFIEKELHVQATFVFTYEDALRDELLDKTQFSPGFGEIKRDKKSRDIMATFEATSNEEIIGLLAKQIIDKALNKKNKGYSTKMTLIIAFEKYWLNGRFMWNDLFSQLNEFDESLDDSFLHCYLINCSNNEIYCWF